MCGILFSLQVPSESEEAYGSTSLDELLEKIRGNVIARGIHLPRYFGLRLTFCGSELRLRGDSFVKQPHTNEDGNILCWNGEVFEGLEIGEHENDGQKLFSMLAGTPTAEEICDVFAHVEGPYAFLFYHNASRTVFYGRDPLGRRSLLVHRPTKANPYLLITSVSAGVHPGYVLEEVSVAHIHGIQLEKVSDATPANVNRNIPDDPPRPIALDRIPAHMSDTVDRLIVELDRSVMLRVRNIPQRDNAPGQARVAVLFSGGIDSTMVAFLADRHVDPDEPIDLLNVAFENPRKIAVKVEGNVYALPKREKKKKLQERLDYSTVTVTYDVPDRITGRQEVEELRRLCPRRKWNFLEINVPFEESQQARAHVEALMFPSKTVMDLSLAIALYFAARGIGQVRTHPDADAETYTSPARVLLNGLGSDELLGGYGRHRTAFKHGGWQAVIDELQLEIDRIPTRNLGRDDRVISSWGKETRHPFLSLSVVNFLAQLPVYKKMDPRLEAGLGEKLLLRLAACKLGLVEASSRKKRAMQFGSHSARMAPGEGDRQGDLLLRDNNALE
ncbi:asparagine synthase-domain-containing protein [Epithele typhae]|uniref:asparagine synthase-domain-containing protein n=1 Tax=Epithele typhae TaxID=378194 RepID=UPI0020073905|nr:asparagine synthase-domain-containing protein [Epithele typhae]KAH9944543.1 asparagine synthase-domain-containing protein [Epithele typhae]